MLKNKQNILIVFLNKYKLLIFFILLVLFQVWIASDRLYIYHFVDEDHHIANAYMMTQGKAIYQNLSSNHQPLPFIFSYFLQKFLPIHNLLNLIKFHHLFILMYGIVWYLILVRKFKYKAIAFGVLFEAIKYLFFGNLFLAETFAVYPLVYLGFLFFHNNLKINFDNIFDKLVFAVSFILIVFNLVPLWPLLFFIVLYLLYRKQFDILAMISLLALIILLSINPLAWFRETIFYNIKYAIPILSTVHSSIDKIKLLLFPYLSLGSNSYLGVITQVFLIIWFLNIIYAFKQKKFKNLKYYFLIYFVLLLANLRVIFFDLSLYEGFHLLPWIGLLITFTIIEFHKFYKIHLYKDKYGFYLFSLLFLFLTLFSKNNLYFHSENSSLDFHTNFSNFNELQQFLQKNHQQGDRILILDSQPLLLWHSGLMSATKAIDYYPWHFTVPEYKQEMIDVINNNPPEFVYDIDSLRNYDYEKTLKTDVFNKKYYKIYKYNKPTNLSVRRDLLSRFSQKLENKYKVHVPQK